MTSFFFPTLPRSRVATLRVIAYSFIWVDVLFTTSWVGEHAHVPGELYAPLAIGRLLSLPTPTLAFVTTLKWMLLIGAAIAALNRPRISRGAGILVAFLYLEWMIVGMSYGKVDHDRFAFLVLLAVLPTMGWASLRDKTSDQSAGWILKTTQIAVVATYFLSSFAKLRYGGFGWLNGATFVRAVIRRGTFISNPLIDHPQILRGAQWGIVIFELLTPLMLVNNRKIQNTYVAIAFSFHLVTFACLHIIFLPHCIAMLSFLALERFGGALADGWDKLRGAKGLEEPEPAVG